MDKGIYLPSPKLDSTLMVGCLQALLDAQPSTKLTSINYDEKLLGYKIYFSEPDETAVLAKEFLTTAGRDNCIYPLHAFLTIRGISRRSNPEYRNDLEDAICERFGTILDINKKNTSQLYEDWYVLVDIPEFEGLKVFDQEHAGDMTILLPKWHDGLEVTFWCKHCKKDGHFRHSCDLRNQSESSGENHKSPDSKTTETRARGETTQTIRNKQSNSESPLGKANVGRISEFPTITTKHIKKMAEDIGREEVMSFSEENLRSSDARKNNIESNCIEPRNDRILTDREIKKEDDVYDDDTKESNLKNAKSYHSKSTGASDSESCVVPKEEPGSSRLDENSTNSFDGPTSNDDEEIVIIKDSKKSNIVNASSHDSNTAGKDEYYNSEDASRSPTYVRRNFPSTSFSETEPFTPGPSNRTHTPSKPSIRVEVTSALSDRLQDCINHACDICQVLDRQKLDAFLIHVKKKSNPIRVALNFTKNADGLKQQLKQILDIYYNTPQAGTKEDMQFIKWLNGLVSRFDGTIPRKRKRHSTDGPPNKK